MRLAPRTATIATILALGAIAAPCAQAGGLLSDTRPDPRGAAQQEALSLVRIYSHQASTPAGVRPNRDEQVAVSTPSVVATPDQATVARDQLGDRQLSTSLMRIAQINGRNIASTPTPVMATTARPLGFQYGDAAIGAGVMAGLVLSAIGGTLAIRRRRQLRHS
jgi:hypothetical protein